MKPVKRIALKEALLSAIAEISNYNISAKKIIDLDKGLVWNNELKELKHLNINLELTIKEKLFLELLLSRKNRLFTYDEIFLHVWSNYNEEASFNALKNLIRRLRKKLPQGIIKNGFNEGYKINIPQ